MPYYTHSKVPGRVFSEQEVMVDKIWTVTAANVFVHAGY